jgi:hypothetical protein
MNDVMLKHFESVVKLPIVLGPAPQYKYKSKLAEIAGMKDDSITDTLWADHCING